MTTSAHYYNDADKQATLIGSGIMLVGVTKTALRNVGPFWDLKPGRKLTTVDLEADTGIFDEDIVDKEDHSFSFKMLTGHFDIIAMISGGLDQIEYTLAATASNVTDEAIVLHGTSWSRLANRMGDRSACSISTVESTGETPTTYVLDTDYETQVDPAGYTRIRRKTAGAITDKSAVLVTYTYKPAIHIKLLSGGMDTIQPRYYQFLHVDHFDEATGEIWGYTWSFYKGIVSDFGDETTPKYNDKKVPYQQSFTIKCNPDLAKEAGKQIREKSLILGQTLADLGLDYLDKDELGVQIRAMITALQAAA